MKKLFIGLFVIVILAAGGVFFLASNLDSIVKAAIEKYGSEVTQASVHVDSVKISLTSGEGSVSGLTVSNPKGFETSKALAFGTLAVKIDTSSVPGTGPIVIKEVVVDGSQIRMEGNLEGDSNLQSIERNVNSYSASGAANKQASVKKDNIPARKIVINDLYIRNSEIGISHPLLKGKELSAKLPTIHLQNIGKSSNGATAEQIAALVLKAVSQQASKVASSELTKNVAGLDLNELKSGGANKLLDKAGSLFKK